MSVDPQQIDKQSFGSYDFAVNSPNMFADMNGEWPGVTYFFFELDIGGGLVARLNYVGQGGIAYDEVGKTSFTAYHFLYIANQHLTDNYYQAKYNRQEIIIGLSASLSAGATLDWGSETFKGSTDKIKNSFGGIELYAAIGGEVGFGENSLTLKVGGGAGLKITIAKTIIGESISLTDDEADQAGLGSQWGGDKIVYDEQTDMMKGIMTSGGNTIGSSVSIPVYSEAKSVVDESGNKKYESADGRWFSKAYMDAAEKNEPKDEE